MNRKVNTVIVDDDPAVAATLVEIMRREGRTAEAMVPSAALVGQLLDANPALLLLDLSLGSIDALTVLKGLSERGFSGTIVIVTGHSLDIVTRVVDFGIGKGLHILPPVLKPIDREMVRAILAAIPEPFGAVRQLRNIDLGEALQQKWLEVRYQPQVDVARRLLRSIEAQVFLKRPGRLAVQVEDEVQRAPQAIQERVLQLVVDTVARDMLMLSLDGWALPIAFNAGLPFIQRPSFVDMLCGVWPDSFARDRLIVEVRETDIMADVELAAETATRLKLYNVDLALDGFGAGFTSFTTVRNVPFSEIKLDPSVVNGVAFSDVKRSLCMAVARLADSLGVPTVAGGVTTADDLKVVHGLGVGIAQGDYFGAALPMLEFNRVLEAQKVSAAFRPRPVRERQVQPSRPGLQKAAW